MIKTWQQRCEEHPDHEGIVTEQMIRDRMQEEIDELRKAAEMALEDICGAKLCEVNSMSSRAEMLRLMDKAAEALRQALAEEKPPVKTYAGGKPNYCTPEVAPEVTTEVPCKTDPRAPHGFNRNASHNLDRYVCECEDWTPVDSVNMSQERVDETVKGEQEPVAWMTHTNDLQPLFHKTRASALNWQTQPIALFTAPPKKEWVGLTEDERSYYLQSAANVGWWQAALFVERALKERNGG